MGTPTGSLVDVVEFLVSLPLHSGPPPRLDVPRFQFVWHSVSADAPLRDMPHRLLTRMLSLNNNGSNCDLLTGAVKNYLYNSTIYPTRISGCLSAPAKGAHLTALTICLCLVGNVSKLFLVQSRPSVNYKSRAPFEEIGSKRLLSRIAAFRPARTHK